MEAFKDSLFALVGAVKVKDEEAINTKKMPATIVVEDLLSLVSTVKAEEAMKKEKREKNSKNEETKNSAKASGPK